MISRFWTLKGLRDPFVTSGRFTDRSVFVDSLEHTDEVARITRIKNAEIDRLTQQLATEHEALKIVRIQRNDARATSDELNDKNDKLRTENDNLRDYNARQSKQIADLRARLEASEAELKYGTPRQWGGTQKYWQMQEGVVLPYNPKSKTVEVSQHYLTMIHNQVRELQDKLVETISLYARPMMIVAAPDAPISYPLGHIDYNRDTVVVDRTEHQRLQERSSLFTIRSGLLNRVGTIIGCREGDDIILVASAVMNDRRGLSDSLGRARNALKSIREKAGAYCFKTYGSLDKEVEAAVGAMFDIRGICTKAEGPPQPTTGATSATNGNSR